MKKLMLSAVLAATSLISYAQASIGTTTPNASAALDVTSITSGLLPPRMTKAQRDAISTPAAGLMVYCTDCRVNGEPQFYNGTTWFSMLSNTSARPNSTIFVAFGVSKVFMAHNLGADNALDPHTPVQGIHGNYYQWGRKFAVANASTSSSEISGWKTSATANGSWTDGSKTANDPCPPGYRVPTKTQWEGVIANNTVSITGNWTNGETNFGSAMHWGPDVNTKNLTLPAAGQRLAFNGQLNHRGRLGLYWSSTENGANANFVNLSLNPNNNSAIATVVLTARPNAYSVRCVSE
jgi:uncharacterized protein (TIGR02145 family)